MMAKLLGDKKVMQIGIVVENIDETVQAWALLLGVKPPSIITTEPVEEAHTQYQGRPTSAQAKLAFFDLGQVTLELIQPIGEPSTWKDQLVRHGSSLHHLAFEIKGMDEQIRGLAKLGVQLVQRGDYKGGRYAYLDGQKSLGAVIELLENEK